MYIYVPGKQSRYLSILSSVRSLYIYIYTHTHTHAHPECEADILNSFLSEIITTVHTHTHIYT